MRAGRGGPLLRQTDQDGDPRRALLPAARLPLHLDALRPAHQTDLSLRRRRLLRAQARRRGGLYLPVRRREWRDARPAVPAHGQRVLGLPDQPAAGGGLRLPRRTGPAQPRRRPVAAARRVSDRPLEIPEHSGEVLLVPGRVDLVAVARRNRDRLSGERTPIAGVPLSDLRVRARDEILTLARAYTAALELGPVAAGDLLLSTGHQPVFPHPGIWVKYLLLDRLAARGHTGLHVIVDSDAMEETGVDLPSHPAAFLERRREVLRAAGAEEPYEGQPAPTGAEWADFIRRVDGHVQTVREEAVRRPWDAFRALGRPAAADYAAFLTALRRRYEGPRRLLDVPVSLVAETPSFRAFFLHIAADATRFLDIHNTHLEAYREQQRIRTEAQPFPNLTAEGNRIELPFWTVAGGRRQRLLLVDLFIHGVSGGRYDRVTDAVIAEFFGVPPPIYAVASATLYLPFAESADPEAARQSLQRMIQEARHNPERVLTEPTPEQRTLIEEKWQWIRRLEAPDLTRPERRGGP